MQSARRMSKRAAVAKNNIDPQRPSTWVKYKKGLCEGCMGGCCSLPLEVSAYDLMRLGLTDELECASSLKKVAKRLIKEGYVRSFNVQTGIFIIEQHSMHGILTCRFIDSNWRCTVYEKRPEVCRQFPKIGPRPGFCPAKRA